MSRLVDDTTWVWGVVLNPEKDEKLLGQYDEKTQVSFIPIFKEKDEALKSIRNFAIEKGEKYEIQAIIYEDVARYASEKGFMIFILNGDGEVLDKIKA